MVMNIPALKNAEQELFIRDVDGVVRPAEGVPDFMPGVSSYSSS